MPRKSTRPRVAPRRRVRRAPLRGARSYVSGQGFYKGFGGHAGRAIGGLVGAANMATGQPWTAMLTPSTGATIGGEIGRRSAAATGFGSYRMPRVNSLLMPELPTIRNSRLLEGATIIRHKEYIGDVISAAAIGGANIVTYNLNPGIQSTFPWLSGVANSFQEYKINGMLFEFRSSSGDALSSTNSTLGEVVLSTAYNAASPFTSGSSKAALLNEEFAVSCKPSVNVIHAIECSPAQTPLDKLYTRSSAMGPNPPAAGTDLRLYDLGVLAVGTFGQQAASVNLGELWCTYEVILFKPRVEGT